MGNYSSLRISFSVQEIHEGERETTRQGNGNSAQESKLAYRSNSSSGKIKERIPSSNSRSE
jgi:hypothetical protein